jgi:thymidylate kinase
MNKGILITIEGVTGVGKSFFAEKMYYKLNQEKNTSVKRFGGFIKDSDDDLPEITKFLQEQMKTNWQIGLPWLCETTLLVAEQAFNIENRIQKLYNDGHLILYENYNDALIAYQLMRGNSLDIDNKILMKILTDLIDLQYCPFNFPKPDYTIYISAPLEITFERLTKRNPRPPSKSDKKMMEIIVENYIKLYEDNPNIIRIVNDNQTNIDEAIDKVIEDIKSEALNQE